MNRYARVDDGVVVEIIRLEDDQILAELYHPDFVTTCREALDEVEIGWTWNGRKFAAPVPPPPPPVVLPASTLYGRMTDAEFNALDDSVAEVEPRRVHRAFSVVSEFREDDEMWQLLVKHLTATKVGAVRQKELLA